MIVDINLHAHLRSCNCYRRESALAAQNKSSHVSVVTNHEKMFFPHFRKLACSWIILGLIKVISMTARL